MIRDTLVWDNQACMPFRTDPEFLPQLARLRATGYDIVCLSVGFDLMDQAANIRVLASFRAWVADHPGELMLVRSVEDVAVARHKGLLGVCFNLQGLGTLDGQVEMIDLYYDLGVRWALMAYNRNNAVGGGCQDADTGLTPFGREVVRRMEAVGMVVCCSHTGWRTAREVIDAATKPVIFSHSNAHAVHPHPRNIPDDLIRACAETGGVIGVNGLSRFIGGSGETFDNSTAGLFRHIDHMVQLVGPRHVGLGLDYVFDTEELVSFYRARPDLYPASKGYMRPTPMVEPERLGDIVETLLGHGYGETAVRQILGENHLRVARACWQ